MTLKQLYENVLTEVNKIESASILLKDFNYLVNKTVYQICNKNYNYFEINQQLTDNMRVLKATAPLSVTEVTYDSLFGGVYEVTLPSDYFHFLGCTCDFILNQDSGCKLKDSHFQSNTVKFTSDSWARISENYYTRPSYKRPYHQLNNLNKNEDNPTNPYDNDYGTDITSIENGLAIGGIPSTIKIGDVDTSFVDRISKVRYGNPSKVRLEIRTGSKDLYTLDKVYVDYLKTPQFLNLTQDELDLVEDTSQVLEWPDYMCYEIINGLAILLLENAGDQRLQTNIPINQTIAQPFQQQSK